ncbi:MAG: anaerobic ribonucleoside-triphosphate reductase activating protein [Clostridia bacterium]|nr:anaerobic ribonucleoside-triphosphate reductase activating protein [Clostridia bacterium]
MKIFGMEKMSLVDYDGKVATTLFTGSCNFKCGFCHNSALVLDFATLPSYSEDEIFAFLEKRKGIIDGVCISGGEPTLCHDLPFFIEKIKKLGYSVKLDTNGTNPDMVKSLSGNGLCDYFAMDIKNNRENYAEIIGLNRFDTTKIEKTVEFLLSGNADYEFRTTLIKEYHKRTNIIKIGDWIAGAKKYFLQRFKLSDTCIQKNLSEVDNATALSYRDILRQNVPNTNLRGYDLVD